MAAQAGEIARRTGVLHCGRCAAAVSVTAGEPIPPCPNGHTEYRRRMQPAKRS